MPWKKVRLAVDETFKKAWLVNAKSLEKIKGSDVKIDKVSSDLPSFMVMEGLRLSGATVKRCALCGKLKEKGRRLKGETTVLLFVCKGCITEHGVEDCKAMIDRI